MFDKAWDIKGSGMGCITHSITYSRKYNYDCMCRSVRYIYSTCQRILLLPDADVTINERCPQASCFPPG